MGTRVSCPSCQQSFLVNQAGSTGSLHKPVWIVVGVSSLALIICGVLGHFAFGSGSIVPTNDSVENGAIKEERTTSTEVASAATNAVKKTNPLENDRDWMKQCVTITTLNSSASGFFIKRNGRVFVATCNHVVENTPFVIVHDLTGREYRAKNAFCSPDRDFALLDVDVQDGSKLAVFPLVKNVENLKLESSLACFGDSEGKGVVVKSNGRLLGIGPKTIETDTSFVPGNSGGPIVLEKDGLVIAVASHLTINTGTWVQGTRFDNQMRRFAVRIDNVNWSQLLKNKIGLLSPDDYNGIMEFGKKEEDSAIRFLCFLYAAEHGDPAGQYQVGWCYSFGIDTEKNETKAVEWLLKAAKQGNADAETQLGFEYLIGKGVRKDEVKAFSYFLSAANKGDAYAMNEVGKLYQFGETVEKDWEKGIAWREKAAEKVRDAASDLGTFAEFGVREPIDFKKALRWYQKAAQLDDSFALFKLGVFFEEGKGVEPDQDRALDYYVKAAKANNFLSTQFESECYRRLGLLYFHKAQGDHNVERIAFEWIKQGAEMGDIESAFELSGCFRSGAGVSIDDVEALKWTLVAAEKGHAAAQSNAGIAYQFGHGCSVDYKKAAYWYEKAVEHGDATAQLNLGFLYENGMGVQEDPVKAIRLYQQAAEQGKSLAMSNLGQCYYFGEGVTVDKQKALYWLRKAAEQDNSTAIEFLRTHPDLSSSSPQSPSRGWIPSRYDGIH